MALTIRHSPSPRLSLSSGDSAVIRFPFAMSNESIAPVIREVFVDAIRPSPGRETPCKSIEVREINDLSGLEPYAAAWNSLVPITPGASYFHTYDWFETYWRHYGGGRRMRVFVVLENGAVAGIVPMVIVRDATKAGRLRSLRYPLDGWGSFYGPIGGQTSCLLNAALKRVLATRRDWDLIDMLWIDRDGADAGATEEALADAGLATRAWRWLPTVQIDVRDGWEAYWGARKSHFRTNVRRDERRLRESGKLEFVRYRPGGSSRKDGDPRWDLYDECQRIAAQSWQGASITGTTLSHISVRDYLRAAHAAAAMFGGVEMCLLRLDGKAIAFTYNYHLAGYVYGLRSGFDAQLCSGGAGTVLMRMMIEDSCARGDRVIDLGPGSAESKRQWRTQIATAWRYTHYAAGSSRAQVLRWLHRLKNSGEPAC
jgi:CelD/BcsL family acetyltransferase involved in cellulose biosynthesis